MTRSSLSDEVIEQNALEMVRSVFKRHVESLKDSVMLPLPEREAIFNLARYENTLTLEEILKSEYGNNRRPHNRQLESFPMAKFVTIYAGHVDKESVILRDDNLLSALPANGNWMVEFHRAAARVIINKGFPNFIHQLPLPMEAIRDSKIYPVAAFNFSDRIYTVSEHGYYRDVQQDFKVEVMYNDGTFRMMSYTTSLDNLMREMSSSI